MNQFLKIAWEMNIELSLLLLAVLFARQAIRITAKVYNAYLLWLSIPIGLLFAKVSSFIDFAKPPLEAVNYAAQNYVIQPSARFDDWTILAVVWLSVAVALLCRLTRQHVLLRQELKEISVPYDQAFKAQYPLVAIEKSEFSPAVYGFLKPTIYFPVHLFRELNDDQIRLIIRHEEHHITQRHLWLNLLWDFAVCLLWFNPLLYFSRQGFRHDQELFCDYLVLNKSTQRDHQSYGHALLTTVSATHSVSLLCSWKSVNQLEERIMNIKQSNNLNTKLIGKITVGFFALSIVGCTSLYAVSADEYDREFSLSQSRHNDGSTESIIRINDKSFVEENGERYIIDAGIQRPMNDEESAQFSQMMEKSKSDSKDSLTHSIDDDGERITWRHGTRHYIEENGKKYVTQGGTRRPMTANEVKEFEQKITQAKKESKQYRKALKKAKSERGSAKPETDEVGQVRRKDTSGERHFPSFELARLKAKKAALESYTREFDRAKNRIVASQMEIKRLRDASALDADKAQSMLESLVEAQSELTAQKEHIRLKLASKQADVESEINTLRNAQAQAPRKAS